MYTITWSFHAVIKIWYRCGGQVFVACRVAKGQEFILDCGYYPEATGWLTKLFSRPLNINNTLIVLD